MINFTFNVDGQKLECTYEGIVADSIKYLNAVFNFSDEWEGLQKYVHFTQGTTTYDMIIIDDKITAERGLNISEGMWHVSLHGSILEDDEIVTRITTNVIQIYVEKSGVIDGDPFPDISPTIGEQIIAQATEKANAASESATSANTSKTAAETAAQTATTKAGDASTYASQALAAKNEAAGSAQTASTKAGEASASAIAAAASAASCEPYDDTEIRGTVDELGRDVTTLYEDIGNKLTKPTEGIAVGKYFRIASIDADGNPVLEACDLPKATGSTFGMVGAWNSRGFDIDSNGYGQTVPASTDNIDNRNNKYRPITPTYLQYAVDSVLCSTSASEALTNSQKMNACERIGAYNPNKEWVLKGKIETGTQWTNVDLSGCTEIFIKGSITTSEAATLLLSAKPMNSGIISLPVTSGTKAVKFSHYITDIMEEMRTIYARFASNLSATYYSSNATTYDYIRAVSTLTEFGFENNYFSKVETCNIQIYAR